MFIAKPTVIEMPVLISLNATKSVLRDHPALIGEAAPLLLKRIGSIFLATCEEKTMVSENDLYSQQYRGEIATTLSRIRDETGKNVILIETVITDCPQIESVIVNSNFTTDGASTTAVIMNLVYSNVSVGVKPFLKEEELLTSICRSQEKLHGICLIFGSDFILNPEGKLNGNLEKYLDESISFVHGHLNLGM